VERCSRSGSNRSALKLETCRRMAGRAERNKQRRRSGSRPVRRRVRQTLSELRAGCSFLPACPARQLAPKCRRSQEGVNRRPRKIRTAGVRRLGQRSAGHRWPANRPAGNTAVQAIDHGFRHSTNSRHPRWCIGHADPGRRRATISSMTLRGSAGGSSSGSTSSSSTRLAGMEPRRAAIHSSSRSSSLVPGSVDTPAPRSSPLWAAEGQQEGWQKR